MEAKSKRTKKTVTTFDELIERLEIKAKSFAIGEIIKEERRLANMTQDELADRTGTKKSLISRIENGHSATTINKASCGRNGQA